MPKRLVIFPYLGCKIRELKHIKAHKGNNCYY